MTPDPATLRALRLELEEATADLRRVTAECDAILAGDRPVPDAMDRAIMSAVHADAVRRADRAKVAAAVLRAEA